MSFCTLVLGAVALLVTGAATIGTDLAQPPVSGRPRAVACPLPWLPVIVAAPPPPPPPYGCTTRTALNYRSFAVVDDGSYEGRGDGRRPLVAPS